MVSIAACWSGVSSKGKAAAKAELAGIALAAGQVLVVGREQIARAADAAGLFVVGYPA